MDTRRNAFTVVEMIVALAVIATIFATVVLTGRSRMYNAEARALATTLESYRSAIVNFRAHVGGYPQTSRQLTRQPDAPGTPNIEDDDICENSFSAAAVARWRGPYLPRRITPQGTTVGSATVESSFSRSPGGSTGVGDLVITVTGVGPEVAEYVEREIDGTPVEFSAGTVRYAGTTLTYRVRISGC